MGESELPVSPDILPAEAESPPLAITRDLPITDAVLAGRMVDQRVTFFRSIREKTVALTYAQDWVDFEGKPYLQASGAERLTPLWGIYIQNIRMEPNLEETRRRLRAGEHVSVEVTAVAGSRVTGERSEFVGGRSSDDGWFADRRGGIQTLDPEDLRKAAYSNLEVNVVMRLLGLRGLTWTDLAQYGITKGGAGGAATFKKSGSTEGQEKRKGLAEEIRGALVAQHGDTPAALSALWQASHFKDEKGVDVGLHSWADLQNASERWLLRINEKLRKVPAPVRTTP
jgi:hypothetical protein